MRYHEPESPMLDEVEEAISSMTRHEWRRTHAVVDGGHLRRGFWEAEDATPRGERVAVELIYVDGGARSYPRWDVRTYAAEPDGTCWGRYDPLRAGKPFGVSIEPTSELAGFLFEQVEGLAFPPAA